LKTAGLAQPSCAAMFSPWAALTLTGASMTSEAAVDPSARAGAFLRSHVDGKSGG
jgi:hypothetical protein